MTYILEHTDEALRLELQKEIEAYSIQSELAGVNLNSRTILDAGCGGGDVSEFLISNSIGSQVWGCDQSEIRVAHAKNKNPSGTFFTSSLESIEAEDNTFDLIICRYVFEYLKDPVATLNEFKRVCKPGGEIVVIDMDGVFKNLFTPNDKFNYQLEKLIPNFNIDLEVGRKISTYFHKANITDLKIEMSSFYFKGSELRLEKENSQMRLSAIRPDIFKVLGSTEGEAFIQNYLCLMEHPASVMFLNKFIVKGGL